MLTKFFFYGTDLASIRPNAVDTQAGDSLPIRVDGLDWRTLIDEIDEGTIHANYLLDALKTWNIKYCPNEQIANACLGLIGELSEYIINPSQDELSDIIYYRAINRYLFADSLDYSAADLYPLDVQEWSSLLIDYAGYEENEAEQHAEFLVYLVNNDIVVFVFEVFVLISGMLSDVGKKVAYHDKFLSEKVQNKYRLGMYLVDLFILSEVNSLYTTLEEIYAYNIEKLSARHGESFNPNYTK